MNDLKFYLQGPDGALLTFEGMTQDQITKMLAQQGKKCQWIDQATFQKMTAAKVSPQAVTPAVS